MEKTQSMKKALDAIYDNEIDVLRSKNCGCFSCGAIFSAREVSDWSQEGGKASAVCPHCGAASVVPDSRIGEIDNAFMSNLTKYAHDTMDPKFFLKNAERFCVSFLKKELTPSAENEHFFRLYAVSLWEENDNREFIPPLIRLILGGSEFNGPNPSLAMEIAMDPRFDNDADILCLRSTLYGLHAGKGKPEVQDKKAVDAAYRSMGLGCLLARCALSDYYYEGTGVPQDKTYAFYLLANYIPMAVNEYFWLDAHSSNEYCHFFLRLSAYFLDESLPHTNARMAVRYALLAKDTLGKDFENLLASGDELAKEIQHHLEDAVNAFGTKEGEIIFDEQTFFDTFLDCNANLVPIYFKVLSYDAMTKTLVAEVGGSVAYPYVDCSAVTLERSADTKTFVFNNVVSYEFDPTSAFFQFVDFREDEWEFCASSPGGSLSLGKINFLYDNEGDEEDDE